MSKKQNIQERRQRVLTHIRFGNEPDFVSLVESTDLSRNEIAGHLAILIRKGRIFRNEQGGYFIKENFNSPRIMRSLNLFLHGCESPTHIFGIGYVDPHSRRGRSLLDP
jgi:hypothetical protein